MMKLRRFPLFCLPLAVLLAFSAAAHARLLHESSRIAVYSTRAEPGHRNSHPITLEADQLSAALSRVRARSGETGEIIELFPPKYRQELAPRLAKELHRIDPDHELHLVTFRHVGSFFSGHRNASAARLFIESGKLNLIFGQIDLYFSEFRDQDRPVPPMGFRKQAAPLRGKIIGAKGAAFADGRNDWVALDLIEAAPPPPPNAPAPMGTGRAPEEKSPEAAINPREKSIEEKLQILKKLREKELITEEEYTDKKREILDSL